jgi:hypothetical protein
MNNKTKIIGISVIAVGLIAFLVYSKTKPQTHPSNTTSISPTLWATPSSQSPTQMISNTSKPTTTTSQYTTEFKAMIRSTFITNCKTKYGNDYEANCQCAANYLSAHYTDSQLADVYKKYHATYQMTPELQAAYDACKE